MSPAGRQRHTSAKLKKPDRRTQTMSIRYDLDSPARRLTRLLEGVTDDHLSARTPCEAYPVGDLLDHLMGLTIAFQYAATKSTGATGSEPGGSPGESRPGAGSAADLHPEWRSRLPLQLNDLVAAWRDPAAWEGTTEAGGVTLPAEVMGSVVVNELVLHGWDLARGTGQPYESDADSTEACFAFTSAMSAPGEEAGREGLIGPIVEVPPDAPLLHRALGLSGRDPRGPKLTIKEGFLRGRFVSSGSGLSVTACADSAVARQLRGGSEPIIDIMSTSARRRPLRSLSPRRGHDRRPRQRSLTLRPSA